jgi:hypothetical protein
VPLPWITHIASLYTFVYYKVKDFLFIIDIREYVLVGDPSRWADEVAHVINNVENVIRLQNQGSLVRVNVPRNPTRKMKGKNSKAGVFPFRSLALFIRFRRHMCELDDREQLQYPSAQISWRKSRFYFKAFFVLKVVTTEGRGCLRGTASGVGSRFRPTFP